MSKRVYFVSLRPLPANKLADAPAHPVDRAFAMTGALARQSAYIVYGMRMAKKSQKVVKNGAEREHGKSRFATIGQ